MRTFFAALVAGAMFASPSAIAQTRKPTIVLVHGAFAESSSWNGVVKILQAHGYPTIAAANPLRSVSGDAKAVAGVISGIRSPIVLVGHSYGGSVISAAAHGNSNVKSLVYVAAFAPEAGETAFGLTGTFPTARLARRSMPRSHFRMAAKISTSSGIGFVTSSRPTFPMTRRT